VENIRHTLGTIRSEEAVARRFPVGIAVVDIPADDIAALVSSPPYTARCSRPAMTRACAWKTAVVVKHILDDHGVNADSVFARIDYAAALATLQTEHEQFAGSHNVWGVPTFIVGEQAVFIPFLHRAALGADTTASVRTIERAVDPVTGWVDLNEFKHTSIPR
jgi:hypothetical protein